jgi:putative ABC transport system substrate-binding protein
VASLARPGGNITGVTFVSSDLAAKRLQYLREIAPNLARVAVLWNPDHIDPDYRETQAAAKTLGVQIQSLEVRSEEDFNAAFQAAMDARSEALIPVSSRLMTTNRPRIIQFSSQRQLLLASGWGPWAREGALLSYGPDLDSITWRAAAYIDKILRGAKPAELPVEQPTRFQLVINAKVAKALGLSIPNALLALADEVIEEAAHLHRLSAARRLRGRWWRGRRAMPVVGFRIRERRSRTPSANAFRSGLQERIVEGPQHETRTSLGGREI